MIYIAGHRGLVGQAILNRLAAAGYTHIVGKSHSDLDLTDRSAVRDWFSAMLPEYVFVAAAKVGGILSNASCPVSFLVDNTKIQMNLMESAHEFGVKKLLFLGSACVYPRLAPEPVSEDSLLTGPLEPSNQWYALAKIHGIKLAQAFRRQRSCDFISAMPTNLYGPGDHYDLQNCHVLPALIRRFHEAKIRGDEFVTCWGDGSARREFLYSDDLADACILAMNKYSDETPINMGSGRMDMTIKELAELIKQVVGFQGRIEWDITKPNGTPRRALNNSKIETLGWKPKVGLVQGLMRTYEDFLTRQS
jgi:GDP-L-fucose synthase